MTTTPKFPGIHLAVIMDGNGRWALQRGLPRAVGHAEGVNAVRRLVESAPDHGVGVLSLFAFSVDNWRRPRTEVRSIMGLLRRYLDEETPRCVEVGVRVTVLGRRDGLDAGLCRSIEAAEEATREGKVLWLRIAINYSSRDAILTAAARLSPGRVRNRRDFSVMLAHGKGIGAPDVDLLVRTGGEKRLSDFLLWESAYAELHFTNTMWPDFDLPDLEAALRDFYRRERRYGRVAPSSPARSMGSAALDVPPFLEDSWLR